MHAKLLLMRAAGIAKPASLLSWHAGIARVPWGRNFPSVTPRELHVASWTLPVAPGGTLVARLPCICNVIVRAHDPNDAPDAWHRAQVTLRAEPRTPHDNTPHLNPVALSHRLGDDPKNQDPGLLDSNALRAAARALALTVHNTGPPTSTSTTTTLNTHPDHQNPPVDANAISSATTTASKPQRELRIEARPESTPSALARLIHQAREWIGGPFRPPPTRFDSDVFVEVSLPGKFNMDLELEDGSVAIHDTFEGDFRLVTNHANVRIHRLKSMYIDLETGEGDLSAVVLQGHVSIRTTDGNIDIAKAQGPSVKMATRRGDVQARALYAEYACLRSDAGSFRLGGAQGSTHIRSGEGNIEVAAVEGSLMVESDAGDIEAQLSAPTSVSLHTKTGDIALTVPPDLRSNVLMQSAGIIDMDNAHLHLSDVEVLSSVEAQKSPNGRRLPALPTDAGDAPIDDSAMTARGWIGPEREPTGQLSAGVTVGNAYPMSDNLASIVARAPSGEISLRAGSWSEFAVPSLRYPFSSSAKPPRFPRWEPAFPPPSEDEPVSGSRATAS